MENTSQTKTRLKSHGSFRTGAMGILTRPDCILLTFAILSAIALGVLIASSVNMHIVADSAACVYQAKEIISQRSLCPGTWTDSTYVHLQTLPTVVGLLLTQSEEMANRVGALITYGLTLAALLAFWRGLKSKSAVLFALVYFVPVSWLHVYFFFTADYYSQFSIGIFLVLSVWLMIVDRPRDRCSNVLKTIAGLLIFAANLMGKRMMAVLCLPMAGSLATMVLFEFRQNGYDTRRIGLTIRQIGMLLGLGLAGNLIYELVLSPVAGVLTASYADDLMLFAKNGKTVIENSHYAIAALLTCIGLPKAKMISAAGILGIASMTMSAAFSIVFPFLAAREYSRLSNGERFMVGLSWCSIGLTFFILIFGTLPQGDELGACARYLMLPMLLLKIVGAQYAYRKFFVSDSLVRRWCAIAIMLLSIALIGHRLATVDHSWKWQWKNLALKLEAEGLHYGYATADNAFPLMFYSKGKLEVPHVLVRSCHVILPGWFMARDWYVSENHVGETFLMLSQEELKEFAPRGTESTVYGKPKRIISLDKYVILVYESNVIAWDLQKAMKK